MSLYYIIHLQQEIRKLCGACAQSIFALSFGCRDCGALLQLLEELIVLEQAWDEMPVAAARSALWLLAPTHLNHTPMEERQLTSAARAALEECIQKKSIRRK